MNRFFNSNTQSNETPTVPSPSDSSSSKKPKNRLRAGLDWFQRTQFSSADGIASRPSLALQRRKSRRRFRLNVFGNEPEHSVKFEEDPIIHVIISLDDYEEEEYQAAFFNRDELRELLERSHGIVRKLELGELDPRVCTRGLEKFYGERQAECRDLRYQTINEVMNLQEQQWETRVEDFVKIAMLSRSITKKAVARALHEARQDIRVARINLRNVDCSEWASFANGGTDLPAIKSILKVKADSSGLRPSPLFPPTAMKTSPCRSLGPQSSHGSEYSAAKCTNDSLCSKGKNGSSSYHEPRRLPPRRNHSMPIQSMDSKSKESTASPTTVTEEVDGTIKPKNTLRRSLFNLRLSMSSTGNSDASKHQRLLWDELAVSSSEESRTKVSKLRAPPRSKSATFPKNGSKSPKLRSRKVGDALKPRGSDEELIAREGTSPIRGGRGEVPIHIKRHSPSACNTGSVVSSDKAGDEDDSKSSTSSQRNSPGLTTSAGTTPQPITKKRGAPPRSRSASSTKFSVSRGPNVLPRSIFSVPIDGANENTAAKTNSSSSGVVKRAARPQRPRSVSDSFGPAMPVSSFSFNTGRSTFTAALDDSTPNTLATSRPPPSGAVKRAARPQRPRSASDSFGPPMPVSSSSFHTGRSTFTAASTPKTPAPTALSKNCVAAAGPLEKKPKTKRKKERLTTNHEPKNHPPRTTSQILRPTSIQPDGVKGDVRRRAPGRSQSLPLSSPASGGNANGGRRIALS